MEKIRALRVILYPLISEEAVSLIESENKITFIVDLKNGKNDIKRAIETLYEVKVEKVNTCITPTGRKKAFVKLESGYNAADLAVKLGIL